MNKNKKNNLLFQVINQLNEYQINNFIKFNLYLIHNYLEGKHHLKAYKFRYYLNQIEKNQWIKLFVNNKEDAIN